MRNVLREFRPSSEITANANQTVVPQIFWLPLYARPHPGSQRWLHVCLQFRSTSARPQAWVFHADAGRERGLSPCRITGGADGGGPDMKSGRLSGVHHHDPNPAP